MGREAKTTEDEGVADDEMVEADVPPLSPRERSLQAIEQYLESLPYTLWGDWDVSIPERRRLAAEWFLEQIVALAEYQFGQLIGRLRREQPLI